MTLRTQRKNLKSKSRSPSSPIKHVYVSVKVQDLTDKYLSEFAQFNFTSTSKKYDYKTFVFPKSFTPIPADFFNGIRYFSLNNQPNDIPFSFYYKLSNHISKCMNELVAHKKTVTDENTRLCIDGAVTQLLFDQNYFIGLIELHTLELFKKTPESKEELDTRSVDIFHGLVKTFDGHHSKLFNDQNNEIRSLRNEVDQLTAALNATKIDYVKNVSDRLNEEIEKISSNSPSNLARQLVYANAAYKALKAITITPDKTQRVQLSEVTYPEFAKEFDAYCEERVKELANSNRTNAMQIIYEGSVQYRTKSNLNGTVVDRKKELAHWQNRDSVAMKLFLNCKSPCTFMSDESFYSNSLVHTCHWIISTMLENESMDKLTIPERVSLENLNRFQKKYSTEVSALTKKADCLSVENCSLANDLTKAQKAIEKLTTDLELKDKLLKESMIDSDQKKKAIDDMSAELKQQKFSVSFLNDKICKAKSDHLKLAKENEATVESFTAKVQDLNKNVAEKQKSIDVLSGEAKASKQTIDALNATVLEKQSSIENLTDKADKSIKLLAALKENFKQAQTRFAQERAEAESKYQDDITTFETVNKDLAAEQERLIKELNELKENYKHLLDRSHEYYDANEIFRKDILARNAELVAQLNSAVDVCTQANRAVFDKKYNEILHQYTSLLQKYEMVSKELVLKEELMTKLSQERKKIEATVVPLETSSFVFDLAPIKNVLSNWIPVKAVAETITQKLYSHFSAPEPIKASEAMGKILKGTEDTMKDSQAEMKAALNKSKDVLKKKKEPAKTKAVLKDSKTEANEPSSKAEAELIEPKAEMIDLITIEPKAELIEPKAELIEPKAELIEPKAELIEPKAELKDSKAEAELIEPKAEMIDLITIEHKAKLIEPKAELIEPKAELIEPKAELKDSKAEAELIEPKAEPKENKSKAKRKRKNKKKGKKRKV